MESGGIVSDLRGGDSFLVTGHILAASDGVHSDMLRVTSQYY
jgi:tartrate dehydratase beta subunit/fumarate hydratase class I family protein